jgi:hypothetical protein
MLYELDGGSGYHLLPWLGDCQSAVRHCWFSRRQTCASQDISSGNRWQPTFRIILSWTLRRRLKQTTILLAGAYTVKPTPRIPRFPGPCHGMATMSWRCWSGQCQIIGPCGRQEEEEKRHREFYKNVAFVIATSEWSASRSARVQL